MSKLRLSLPALLFFAIGLAYAATPQTAKHSSRDEYRACLQEGDGLIKRRDQLKDAFKDHATSLKLWQDEMQAHAATQPIDATAEATIDAYNAKLEILNTPVELLNKTAERLTLEATSLNTTLEATNRRCAGMVVTMPDYEAVQKERAKATKR